MLVGSNPTPSAPNVRERCRRGRLVPWLTAPSVTPEAALEAPVKAMLSKTFFCT